MQFKLLNRHINIFYPAYRSALEMRYICSDFSIIFDCLAFRAKCQKRLLGRILHRDTVESWLEREKTGRRQWHQLDDRLRQVVLPISRKTSTSLPLSLSLSWVCPFNCNFLFSYFSISALLFFLLLTSTLMHARVFP